MAKPVKTRSYNSPRRQEQAAATRREILHVARRLFEDQGYAATTMAAIASEAGVALKTVYVAFETKSGVLRALWNSALRGDEDEIPVAQRAWYRQALEEPDPERQLRLNARNARAAKTRIGGLFAVIRDGAQVDSDIAALWARIESEFYENQERIVKTLHRKGALLPGLGPKRATDILWTLNHPDVWLLLVGARGWKPERFERWFADTAVAQLLDPSAVRHDEARA